MLRDIDAKQGRKEYWGWGDQILQMPEHEKKCEIKRWGQMIKNLIKPNNGTGLYPKMMGTRSYM